MFTRIRVCNTILHAVEQRMTKFYCTLKIVLRRPPQRRVFYVGACITTPHERFYVRHANKLKRHCDQNDCMVVVWHGTATAAQIVERQLIAFSKTISGNFNYQPGGEGFRASSEESWVYVCLGSSNIEPIRKKQTPAEKFLIRTTMTAWAFICCKEG